MRQLRIITPIIALIATLVSGCGDPVEPLGMSSVRVSWRLAPHGCDGVGVEEVTVALRPTTPGGKPVTERLACGARAGEISGVIPGRYDVEVSASPRGHTEWRARTEDLIARPDRIEDAGELVLSAAPGAVEVVWRFDNGELCGTNEVRTVRALVFDTEDTLHGQLAVPCEVGRLSVDDIPPGAAVILALGERDAGDVLFEGLGSAEVARGRTTRVEIELSAP